MKLKIKADDIRILSDFYNIGVTQLARKAEIAFRRADKAFLGGFSTVGDDVTVIDVTDEYTPDQWREMIAYYTEREIQILPEVITSKLTEARREAKQLRDTLPKYVEV
ncbi:MAG: hypothetical protein ACTSQA_08960 [Candidatus Heimdallarchaeaceae archaeon]